MRSDEKCWFEPKRYGYGAGLPLAWQGWLLILTYVAVVTVAGLLLIERTVIGFAAIATVATGAFLVICARKTHGGWRWRWGGDEKAPVPRAHLIGLVALVSISVLLAIAGLIVLATR